MLRAAELKAEGKVALGHRVHEGSVVLSRMAATLYRAATKRTEDVMWVELLASSGFPLPLLFLLSFSSLLLSLFVPLCLSPLVRALVTFLLLLLHDPALLLLLCIILVLLLPFTSVPSQSVCSFLIRFEAVDFTVPSVRAKVR